jgi:hypothetical protein
LKNYLRHKGVDYEVVADRLDRAAYRDVAEEILDEMGSPSRRSSPGSRARRAARVGGVMIGGVLVSILVQSVLLPEAAKAEWESREERAAAVLRDIVNAYLVGDVARANALRRREWDDIGGSRTGRSAGQTYVNSIPADFVPSGDLARQGILEAINVWLDMLQSVAMQATACLADLDAGIVLTQQRLNQTGTEIGNELSNLRRKLDGVLNEVMRRVAVRAKRVSPYLPYAQQMGKRQSWLLGHKISVSEFLREHRRALEAGLRQTRQNANTILGGSSVALADREGTARRLNGVVRIILHAYWNDFAVHAVYWEKQGLVAEHATRKQMLQAEYDNRASALVSDDPFVAVPVEQWKQLSDEFIAREKRLDQPVRLKHGTLYSGFDTEWEELERAAIDLPVPIPRSAFPRRIPSTTFGDLLQAEIDAGAQLATLTYQIGTDILRRPPVGELSLSYQTVRTGYRNVEQYETRKDFCRRLLYRRKEAAQLVDAP